MKWFYNVINFFLTTLDANLWTASTWTISVTDKTVDWYTLVDWEYKFNIVLDLPNKTQREVFRIWKVVWSVLYYDKRISPTGVHSHTAWVTVQINDFAELLNTISKNVDMFWYAETVSWLIVQVYGWLNKSNWTTYDSNDIQISVIDNDTSWIWMDYSDWVIKAVADLGTFDWYVMCEVIASWWEVITLTDKRVMILDSTWDSWADWQTVLNGVSNPTTQWADWDFYINTTTNQIFWPKVAWSWPVSWVNIKWEQWDKWDPWSITEAPAETEATIDTNILTDAVVTTDWTTYIRLTNANTSYTNYWLAAITSVDKNWNTSRSKAIVWSFTVPDTSWITYVDWLFIDKITWTSSFAWAPVYRELDNVLTWFNKFEWLTQFDWQVKFSYNINAPEANTFDASLWTKQWFNFASWAIAMNFSNLVQWVTLTFAVTVVTSPVTLTFWTATDLDWWAMAKLGIWITAIPELAVWTHLFAAEVFTTAIHIAYLWQSQTFA